MSGGFDPTAFLQAAAGAERTILRVAREATEEFAEQVMADSQELCPVSPVDNAHPLYTGTSGALRDSGTVQDAEVSGDKIVVELHYNTDYGAAVHEGLEANHKYPGAINSKAQAKYLEQPLREAAPRFGPFLQDKVKGAIRG